MDTPWHFEDDRVRIRKLCVGGMENNAYVVACARSGRAVVIDAADEEERLRAEVEDVSPVAVLTTHGHWDHVQAAGLAERLGVPFAIHPADTALAGRSPDLPLWHGQRVEVGELGLDVLHTPGHTSGSTCFVIPGHLFSGDTLFPGGPGATGGPEDFRRIMQSLRQHLFVLPDATLVHPGHGMDTTLGTERPHLEEWERRGW